MTPPALEFKNVQVRVGARVLLDVPTFRLEAGEHVSLIGPNGSGKTTFLHTAAFLRFPDTGQVSVTGQAADRRNAARLRQHVAIVFQDPLLFRVDVLHNVTAGLRFQGVERAEAQRRAHEFLQLFGVSHLASQKPTGLSGGEAARVALARAFATYPDLMLLDEPFSALDAATRADLLPELRERLADRGAAAILVTHDIAEAFVFARRVIVLDNGKVIADGDIHALTMHPPTRRAAELLGVENLLEARHIERNQAWSRVEIASDLSLSAKSQSAPSPGTNVHVTIPAAMIQLAPATGAAPQGWNSVQGRVEGVTPQPGYDLVVLRTAGPALCIRVPWGPENRRWLVGDDALASFPPEAAWIIPAAATG
jgi:ABC-type sulfate/molybdate transport systems ATPase subunit